MKKTFFLIACCVLLGVTFVNAEGNTNYGTGALSSNTGGIDNSAFGYKTLYYNTTGLENGAFGFCALKNNTIGDRNYAFGNYALYRNTSGDQNIAIGYYTLEDNTTGSNNTAIGHKALRYNTTASKNTATGYYSMYSNTTGYENTAMGYEALKSNITGYKNVAVGHMSLRSNTSSYNTGVGHASLYRNTSGNQNSASGYVALYSNTTGNLNTAQGSLALYNNITGSYNTAVGYRTSYGNTSYSNTTAIGYNADPTASNQVRIGNSNVTSIGGQVSWSTLSDGRFKKEIKQDVNGLAFINELKPVSYIVDVDAFDTFMEIPDSLRIKSQKAASYQTGFVAQDVEAAAEKVGFTTFNGVNAPENDKDYYSIRYAEFVVPLVKAVQELSALDKEKNAQIALLEEKIDRLETILIEAGLVTDIETAIQLKSEMVQNRPNPFSAATEIACNIPEGTEQAELMVFDMNGSLVKTISINERGNCLLKVNADELNGAGMYIYSLFVNNKEISTKRMIVTE